jgi:hypothetical protein
MAAVTEFSVLDEAGLRALLDAAKPRRRFRRRKQEPPASSGGDAPISGLPHGAVIAYLTESVPGFGETFGYESELLSAWLDLDIRIFNQSDADHLDRLPPEAREPARLSKFWEDRTGELVSPQLMEAALRDLEARIYALEPEEILVLRVSERGLAPSGATRH